MAVFDISARGNIQCRGQKVAALLPDRGSTPLRARFEKPARRARRLKGMDGIQSDRGHCRLREQIEENCRNRLSCYVEGSREV